MSQFVVLDVGHGNCAIIRDQNQVAVVDAPTRALLLDTLDDLGITRVHHAFISHADRDHLAGILALLTSGTIKVDRIYLNPDAARRTKAWKDLLVAASVATRKGTCVIYNSLTSTLPGTIPVGDIQIEVVAPSPTLVLAGSGKRATGGALITANSLSAVLRVSKNGAPAALLPGDLDDAGLADAQLHGANLAAQLLVFPHHGGFPGGNPMVFTGKILGAVQPETVIFSNGRGRHDNPKQLIVAATKRRGCYIACTQLSERCASLPMSAARTDLEPLRAAGRESGASCGGSMTIELDGGARRSLPAANEHASFVDLRVPTPMCR